MKDKLTKIKVFLATTNDLHEESVEMADLIENLNYILEKKDVHIYLTKWDYLDAESSSSRKNIQYDKTLEECDICIIAFGKEFGSYKEEELQKAFEKVCIKDINPKKLYVYFKSVDKISDELKTFRDSFPEQYYKHFTGKFSDSNSLRASFLIEFHRFQTNFLQNSYPLNIDNSKIKLNHQEILVAFNSLPFVCNVENLKKIKNHLSTLDILFNTPNFSPDNPLYSEQKKEYNKLKEEKKNIESKLWETAIMLSEYKEQGISEKLKEAIEYFEEGKIELVREILEEEEKKNNFKITINELKKVRKDKEKILNDLVDTINKEEKKKEELKESIRRKQLLIKTEEIEMKEGWGERVLNLHDEILEITKEVYGENSEEFLLEIMEFGTFYDYIGFYKESLQCKRNVLEIVLNGNIDKSYLGLAYNNLSTGFAYLNDYTKAIEYAEKALVIRRELFGEHHITGATTYNNLGCYFSLSKEYQKGLFYKEKASEILFDLYGSNIDYANSCHNIGCTYLDIEEYDKAIFYFLKSLKVIKNLNEQNNELRINTLEITIFKGLSQAFLKIHNIVDSIKYANQYLYLSQKVYGQKSLQIVKCYKNLSFIHAVNKNYDKAIKLQLRALNILLQKYPDNIEEKISIYNNLSILYDKIKNLESSICYKLKLLEIYENNKNSIAIVEGYIFIANKYEIIGKNLEAIKYLEKVLNLIDTDSNLVDFDKSELFFNLGSLYRLMEDYRNSLKYRLLTLEINQKVYGVDSEESANAYNNVGAQYRDLEEYVKALEYIGMAYEISKENKRIKEAAIYSNRLGRVYVLMGNNETAKEKFEEALRLLPEDHPEAIDTRRRLEELGKNDLKESEQRNGAL